ncbi:MAG TPA: FHA domain-containing protein, partial [Candidatus Hydrogenedentes bacterium]|nr:FHA domain-containing protein [Candidatus Hydrogenedentota bacterium]
MDVGCALVQRALHQFFHADRHRVLILQTSAIPCHWHTAYSPAAVGANRHRFPSRAASWRRLPRRGRWCTLLHRINGRHPDGAAVGETKHVMLRIRAKTGPDAGLTWKIGAKPLVIGREKGCDIRVLDLLASRRHCELLAEKDGVRLRDLKSRNATMVNGEAVEEC